MREKNKILTKTMLITSLLCLVPVFFYLAVWNQLPDMVPVHFNAQGEPDGYSSKIFAAFGLPGILLAVNLLVNFSVEADPKSRNTGKEIKAVGKWMVPVLSIVVNLSVLLYALGLKFNMSLIAYGIVGLVLLLVGNYLPKSKRNYTVGIKLPWTLNSDENWNKTHRLAGYLFMLGGILMIINMFWNVPWMIFVILVLCALVPAVYSYLLYRKSRDHEE